jgi:integron integrase
MAPSPLHAVPIGPPKLLDRVRAALRARHYSRRTEASYVAWVRRFVLFHGKRHPSEMSGPEVGEFLSSLATERNVSASTQNQALAALLFLYRHVLEVDLPWLEDVVRARRPLRLPTVLTRGEVAQVLDAMDGVPRLVAIMLYGAGLRLLECLQLRVKDVDFAGHLVRVRAGKGNRDRVALLPEIVRGPLAEHLDRVRRVHRRDVERGGGRVRLPSAMAKKLPAAAQEWAWQWVFPASRTYVDPEDGVTRRHHLHESVVQREVNEGCGDAERYCKAGDVPHVPALVRDTSARGGFGHSDRAGAARAPGCEHDDDLYACAESGTARGAQPGGPAGGGGEGGERNAAAR